MFASAVTIILSIFFMGLVTAMVVLKYRQVYQKMEATRSLDVIEMKNNQGYDPKWGGIICSFFPLNIILIPLYIPMLLMRSARLNESILKLQYSVMVTFYTIIALAVSILGTPLMFLKLIGNQIY